MLDHPAKSSRSASRAGQSRRGGVIAHTHRPKRMQPPRLLEALDMSRGCADREWAPFSYDGHFTSARTCKSPHLAAPMPPRGGRPQRPRALLGGTFGDTDLRLRPSADRIAENFDVYASTQRPAARPCGRAPTTSARRIRHQFNEGRRQGPLSHQRPASFGLSVRSRPLRHGSQ